MKLRDGRYDEKTFKAFLEWLHPEPETAAAKFEDFRERLRIYFTGRRCAAWCDELTDRTLDRVVEKLAEGQERPANQGAFVFAVARYILLEFWKEPRGGPLLVDPPDLRVSEEERPERLQCLARCLAELPSEDQDLAVRYYALEKREKIEDRKVAAATSAQSQQALRVRMFRIREKLRKCIERCLAERESNSSTMPVINK